VTRRAVGLTKPRRRALLTAAAHDHVRVSTTTDADRGLVYWQTADWLVRIGIATYWPGRGYLELNDDGKRLAREIAEEG
jgi:hypothetical protein